MQQLVIHGPESVTLSGVEKVHSNEKRVLKSPRLRTIGNLMADLEGFMVRSQATHRSPYSNVNRHLRTFLTRSEAEIVRLVVQRAVGVGIAGIFASVRTRHIILWPILRTAAPRRDAEVARQIARLEHEPRTAALRLALLTTAEGASCVLSIADAEGSLRRGAVPGTLA
jgi:citrate lyase beta subunit